jgi:molecular chaperone Hsp33
MSDKDMTESVDMAEILDDHVTVFQLDGQSVRGRSVRLGAELERAINAGQATPRYPERVARLLGEAMMIGALVARALKFEGRLIVQCHGTNKGAVSLLMADCTTDGHIRGYARWDPDMLRQIELDNRNPGAESLLGGGTFSMTIDQGPDMDQYQGLAAVQGESLSACAEHYFAQSEQIPTKVQLACGQVQVPGGQMEWRGGGMMLQRIAQDTARAATEDDWLTAKSLFGTLTDAELIDPDLPHTALLYRLFHEGGVRILETMAVDANCRCSRARLLDALKGFQDSALEEMAENGTISANCEFCAAEYVFDLNQLKREPSEGS